MRKNIIVAVTSNDNLGNSGQKTGYAIGDIAHLMLTLLHTGIPSEQITLVSPRGGRAPIDSESVNLSDRATHHFFARPDLLTKLSHTLTPQHLHPTEEYDAVFYMGGRGSLWDFPQNPELAHLTASIYERQGIVGAIGYGSAALVNVQLSPGHYLVKGKYLATLTEDEERTTHLDTIAPFSLRSALVDRGALHEPATLWQPHVVVDSRLITAQNSASARSFSEAITRLLLI